MTTLKLIYSSYLIRNVKIQRRMMQSSSTLSKYIHYSMKKDVAILKMDDPVLKVNTLSKEFQAEMMDCFKKASDDPSVKSMVVISAKPTCFIAGADIQMLAACKTKEELSNLSSTAQRQMDIIENSGKPIVAAIMGSCMGGGLEFALACHYRIAVQTKATMLSFPEVMLGILPGAGGTQRIFKYCNDYLEGVQMILTGKNVRADKAKKLGIIDHLVQPLGPGLKSSEEGTLEYLETIAVDAAQKLSAGTLNRSSAKSGFKQKIVKFLLGFGYGRDVIFGKVRTAVMKQTHGLYPAPLKIVELCETSAAKGSKVGYDLEAQYFGELGVTKESNALFGLFSGRNKCTKNRFGAPSKKVGHITVLGAGLMGAGISQVSIEKGLSTTLKDVTVEALAKGAHRIQTNLAVDVKKKRYSGVEADKIMSKLQSVTDYKEIPNTDIVIEAVFEDLDLKHKIIKEIEEKMPPNVVFATNTSALPIHEIAKASSRPNKVIGMHYFSPVEKMPLLEVITTPQTDQDTKAIAVEVGLRQGKVVIVVGDGPGFYTTRALVPLITESARLLQEGVRPTQIDEAMRLFGWPVGVMALGDEVGLDVSMHVAQEVGAAFGDRMKGGDPRLVIEMVQAGFLGRKSGKGFYNYADKSKNENLEAIAIIDKYRYPSVAENTVERIQYRMFTRFVNESVMCLQEGILFDPIEGDIGAVFGIGFPPFLGGPFRYLDNYGAAPLVKRMAEYESQYGIEFRPCELLLDHANNPSKKFHKS